MEIDPMESELDYPAKTMNDKYGDGSNHLVCNICGNCITCGDCRCNLKESENQNKGTKK